MLTPILRFAFYKTLFTEIYKKCGFMVISHRNTYINVEALPYGKVKVCGNEFHIALSSNPLMLKNRLIVLCDIYFNQPTKADIDNFAKKIAAVKTATDLVVEGVITYLEPISDELAIYAHTLGVHTLTYFGNPVISPFVNEIELLCGDYRSNHFTEKDIDYFRETFAGYLQGFCTYRQFGAKPLFRDGFQIMFINILESLESIELSFLGFTSGGYLVHLFGKENAKILLENDDVAICTLKPKIKNGLPYKALFLKDGSLGFSLTLPTGIKRCTLFKGEHTIKLVSSTFETDSIKIE